MMKTSQLSSFVFALHKAYRPARMSAVTGPTQQQIQQIADPRNRDCGRASFGDFPSEV